MKRKIAKANSGGRSARGDQIRSALRSKFCQSVAEILRAALLKNLSVRLTGEFGAGFDERELRRMRQFDRSSPIRGALRPELTWTHTAPTFVRDQIKTVLAKALLR